MWKGLSYCHKEFDGLILFVQIWFSIDFAEKIVIDKNDTSIKSDSDNNLFLRYS